MITLLGLPGAGKGSISKALGERIGYKHLSVGDALRAEIAKGSEVGQRIKVFLDKGELAPIPLSAEIVRLAVEANDKLILDGYPRTVEQAKILDEFEVPIEAIIFLEVPKEVLFDRLKRRRNIEHREDDTDELIVKRYERDAESVQPLLEFYQGRKNFFTVDGNESIEEVTNRVERIVKEKDKVNETTQK